MAYEVHYCGAEHLRELLPVGAGAKAGVRAGAKVEVGAGVKVRVGAGAEVADIMITGFTGHSDLLGAGAVDR